MTSTTTPPTEFTLRLPTWDDLPAVVELLNAYSEALLGVRPVVLDDFRREMQEPGFDFTHSVRLAITPDDLLVGFIIVYSSAPFVRHRLNVRVHPAHVGCGIGTALLTWAEERARAEMRKAPPDARVGMGTGILHSNAAEAQRLQKLGFIHVRSFSEMKIELTSPPPQPVWSEGITIRSMILNQDEEAAFRANDEAFRDHWGYIERPFDESFARWLHHLHSDPNFDPSLYFLAMDGDQIAGFAFNNPKDNEYPDTAWVEHLGVRRPWRRRGLARALLLHTFGEVYRRGIYKVGLGVDASSLTGATQLYENVGMHVFREWDTYEKELRPGRDLSTQSVDQAGPQ